MVQFLNIVAQSILGCGAHGVVGYHARLAVKFARGVGFNSQCVHYEYNVIPFSNILLLFTLY